MAAARGTTGHRDWRRLILGVYLVVHFVALLPYGTELFSNAGVLPDSSASPLIHAFPNVLASWDAPAVVTGLLLVAVGASVCLAFGWRERTSAIVAAYVLACLLGRNPLISNPSLPFVGLLLVAFACLPRGPDRWRANHPTMIALWIVVGLAYTYSGVAKLGSPSWVDGTAVAHVLENPLARPTELRAWLLGLSPRVLAAVTWGTLALEIAYAPLVLHRRTRRWAWLAMVVMHVGLVFLIDFADLSIGMIVVHCALLDDRWSWGPFDRMRSALRRRRSSAGFRGPRPDRFDDSVEFS